MKYYFLSILFILNAFFIFSQSDDLVWPGISFNLQNPGARAMGMGGAFIGAADDASTAISNPAGLGQLKTSEIGYEFKSEEIKFDYITSYSSSEDIQLNKFETINPIQPASFVSLIFNSKGANFGFFYHNFVHYETDFEAGNFINYINSYVDGKTMGFSIGSDLTGGEGDTNILFGLSGGYSKLYLNYDYFTTNLPLGAERRSANQTKDDYFLSAGTLLKIKGFSLGLSYQRNPEFKDIERKVTYGLFGLNIDKGGLYTFKVPDKYGIGTKFDLSDMFVMYVDGVSIQYSQLYDDFYFWVYPSMQNETINKYVVEASKGTVTAKDIIETHIGFEFIIPGSPGSGKVFVLRGGYYHEPAHPPTFDSNAFLEKCKEGLLEQNCINYAKYLETFNYSGIREDQHHLTFGIGIRLSKNFIMDGAMDKSSNITRFLFSFISRW